ncbi:hypothetical protein FJ444_01715 [Aestuariibacter sp. GS-14]|uniref:hypothetical protein n=1 Tax=Aestuariibacter sp. GS-14 TaxID=2590670 RepID=UPI001126F291|nr:hypothetical protein [Aestuariibacter sp. GS-14]TPV62008.1 hypothetical protein FJ444_01715 [Aestuariibacter sp. GS-14]
MNTVKLTAYDDFQILMRAGVIKMLHNIAYEISVDEGLNKHLRKVRKKSCSTNLNVKVAEATLHFVYEHLHIGGLKDILTGRYNLKSIYEHGLGITKYNECNCLIPDGWVVVRTEFNDGKIIHRIFSSWVKDDEWRISSGDHAFSSLVDFGSFFVWKQKSGTVYKLMKNRADNLSSFAREVLIEQILEPAEDWGFQVLWMNSDDLHHEIALKNDILRLDTHLLNTLPKESTEDSALYLSELFEKIESSNFGALSLFTSSAEDIAKSYSGNKKE